MFILPAITGLRPRRSSRLPLLRAAALVAVSAVLGGLGFVPHEGPVEYGRAGVVGDLFRGGELSCGGTYNPDEPALFHPTLPCGAEVLLVNPQTGASVPATVTSQAVMFRPNHGRVADISIAAAKAIGLNPDASRAQPLAVQRLSAQWPSWLAGVIGLPSFPSLPQVPSIQPATLEILTKNLVAECGNCPSLGMLAVARVTLNRAHMGFMGATSVAEVIKAPNQFSWVKGGPFPTRSHGSWNLAEDLAEAALTDQLSGPGLGLFYRMGWEADHFYATAISSPAWSKRMEKIDFATDFERKTLRHRYYVSGRYTLASR